MSALEPRQLATIRDWIEYSVATDHAQYISGYGAGYFDHAFTGVGDTISEAVEDLLDQIGQADLGVDEPEYHTIAARFTRDYDDNALNTSCHGDCLEQYKREIAEADLSADILDQSFSDWHEQCEIHTYAFVRFDLVALPIWQVYDHDAASWTVTWERINNLSGGSIVFNGWGANSFRQRILNELRWQATHADPAPLNLTSRPTAIVTNVTALVGDN